MASQLSAERQAQEAAQERVRAAVTTLNNEVASAAGVGLRCEFTEGVADKKRGLPHLKVRFLRQETLL